MKKFKNFIQSFILAITLLCGTAFFSACGGVNVTDISINEGPQILEVGQEYTFTATLTPSKASKKDITWSSSNTSVATINENGKVLAINSGTTIITAMSKKNSNIKDFYPLTVLGEDKIAMLPKTYTYDGTPKVYEAYYVPPGLEVRYNYRGTNVLYDSSLAPTDAGTYTVSAYNANTGENLYKTSTLTINKKKVKFTIGNYTKRYGEDDPIFTASISGLVGEDTLDYTLERTPGENVESYKINAIVTPHKNYETSNLDHGTLTIEKLPVSIIVDNKTSTYGDALLTTTYTLQDENNMLLDDKYKTQIYGSPIIEKPANVSRLDQGTYAINGSNLTSTNLEITDIHNGTYRINKRTVTVSIADGQFKYSGEEEPALRYGINGTLEGDDLTGCLSRAPGESVGFYEYQLDQSINTNYSITTETGATNYKFEIKSNEVVISFNSFELYYANENKDGIIPDEYYNYSITINGTPIEYTTNGIGNIYLNNTDAIILGHEVSKVDYLSDEEKVIFYQKWKILPTKVSTIGYSDPAKYNFTIVEGFKYLKFIGLNISAVNNSKVYGETDPEFTFEAEGFLDGDTIENVLQSVELKRDLGEDVLQDGYEISLDGDIKLFDTKGYYKITFTPGVFNIEQRELRIKPISYTAENPVYYGETPKDLIIDETDLNLSPRDSLENILTGELNRADNEDVGQYPIFGTNLKLTSNNYRLVYTQGVYTIVPRPILVNASPTTMQYGDSISRYQYGYTVVEEFSYIDENGDEQIEVKSYIADTPVFTGNLQLTVPGILYANNTYEIGQGSLTAGGNFEIIFTSSTLTVVPREVSISFTPETINFRDYNALDDAGKLNCVDFHLTPSTVYGDKCIIKYIGFTSQDDTGIISLNKDANTGEYILTLEFTAANGAILNNCYNVTVNENFVELFYLGESTLNLSIDSLTQEGTRTVTKTYGDDYRVAEVFKITLEDSEYHIEYPVNVFNIKSITDQESHDTPSSTRFNAGSYTVTAFKSLITILDSKDKDVSSQFALKIDTGTLVINKANLEIAEKPTLDPIVYGTAKPTFNGGHFTFVDGGGITIDVFGGEGEFSTSSTATYSVQTTAHQIMATFTPNDKNFNSVTITGLDLIVTKKMLDTTSLEWSYGSSVENYGTVEGSVYTTYTTRENTTYDDIYTPANTYNIPISHPDSRLLRDTLGLSYRYHGVAFHDEEDGDTGFMYYIEAGQVKKVFPGDSNNFYIVLDKSSETFAIYYNDGSKDYLLTNSSEYNDGNPVYTNRTSAPTTSGVYLVSVVISSLSSNYAVYEDGNPTTKDETITYYNAFMIEKIAVYVFGFTDTIEYNARLEFYYNTNPEEIYGNISTYWDKDPSTGTYTERTTDPVDVGEYAVTFTIDKANYYYHNDHFDFSIVPVTINVLWANEASFDYSQESQTRHYKVFAGPALNVDREEILENLVYDSSDPTSIAPDWLGVRYINVQGETTTLVDEGNVIDVIPPINAGTYNIEIYIIEGNDNYVGTASSSFEIKPIYYNGTIALRRLTLTYDITYSESVEGAQRFYNLLVFGKENPVEGDDDGMLANAPYGSEVWNTYTITLSYKSNILDPTGEDNAAVLGLNRAGGPYIVTLSIKSNNGNIRETISTNELYVNKTSVPTMAFDTGLIEIAFTGSNIYNALTTLDKSAIYIPTRFDESTLTYSYDHNGDRSIFFGIDYTYERVFSTEETNGPKIKAPINPDSNGWIYLVKAHLTVGANYYEPTIVDFSGYFTVGKTTAQLFADDVEFVYTGSNIELPTAYGLNGAQQPLVLKYEDDANIDGLYVSREIINKVDDSTVDFIKDSGTYQINFVLHDKAYFFETGSIFTTTCNVIVNKKPIDGLDKYVVARENFVSTELKGALYINANTAQTYNADYTNNTATKTYIQLYVTDKLDGSGQSWLITGQNSTAIQNLPAGQYYYYVDVASDAPAGNNIYNYTRSELIPFVVVRKEVVVSIKDDYQDGITIEYTEQQQYYDINYLEVRNASNNQLIKNLTIDDFKIEYKSAGQDDSAYTETAPVTNGVYNVKIICQNGNYQSEPIYTTLTIDAPLVKVVEGNMSYTYGFVDELSLNFTAETETTTHTIIFDGSTNKYSDAGLANECGKLFIMRDNFGVTAAGGSVAANFEYNGRVIGSQINSGLITLESKMYTKAELQALPAGLYNMTIVYISNDVNYAITFVTIPLTVTTYEIDGAAISSSKTQGISYDFTTNKFGQSETTAAISEYGENFYTPTNRSYWRFANYEINKAIAFDVEVKIKNPNDDNYDNATTITLTLVATFNTTISGESILASFESMIATEATIKKESSSLTFDNANYSIKANSLSFELSTTFEKQEASAFTEKLNLGQLVEVQYLYEKVFLDEYWANLSDDTNRENANYPTTAITGKDTHAYLYNLINLPGVDNVDKFRNAWDYDSTNDWLDLYKIEAYNSYTIDNEGNITPSGDAITTTNIYDENDAEDASGKYKYDLNASSNAGLYYLEITLNTSKYFKETTLGALFRIKPATFYAKTISGGSANGLIDTTIPEYQSEVVKVYPSDSAEGSQTPEDASYTIRYYREGVTDPVYVSYYDGSTYTRKSGYDSYAALLASVGGAEALTVSIVPDSDYVNSMYVEDIQIIVINGAIELGTYNINDKFDFDVLRLNNPTIRTLYDISKQGDNGLTWPQFAQSALAASSNSLTEGAISALRALARGNGEAGYQINPDDNGNLVVNIEPDSDEDIEPDKKNQVKLINVPLSINFEDGSLISVMTNLTINLKLVTTIDTYNFTYNGNPQAPIVTAYFQGWTATIKMLENGDADIENMQIVENELRTPFTSVTPTVQYYSRSDAILNNVMSSTPTSAGDYAVISTYTVTFPNYKDAEGNLMPVTYVCVNNFTISPKEVKVTLSYNEQDIENMGSIEVLYDGQDHVLTATVAELSSTASVQYYSSNNEPLENGAKPCDAGIYYVIATYSSTNYFGTAVATLTIKPTSTRIEIIMPDNYISQEGEYDKTYRYAYSGDLIEPTYKIFNEAGVEITSSVAAANVKITYNGVTSISPLYAGAYEYKIAITADNNFYANTLKVNYVIEKAEPLIEIVPPTNTTYIGQGSTITPTFKIDSAVSSYTTITYNGSTSAPWKAGVYEVYINCNPPTDSNYLPTVKTFVYTIYPKELTVTYDASAGTIVKTYSPGMSLRDLGTSAPSDASVVYTYQGFEYNDDGTLSSELLYLSSFPQNAGVYSIIATPQSTNYTGRVTRTLILARATPVYTFNISGGVITYNGDTRSPQIVETISGLNYVTTYTGLDNDSNEYSGTTAPINAGSYVVTVSFAGNKNYCAVEYSQAYTVEKASTITLKFDSDSLSQKYTGSPLTPTAKAYLNNNEKADLTEYIELLYGQSTTLPTKAGTYVVAARLVHCNYSATVITTNFIITKSDNFTVNLFNSGQLSLGATSIGEVEIDEDYLFLYTGKTYLANGELSAYDNYESFDMPTVAGSYTAVLIADNYEAIDKTTGKAVTYPFVIRKLDLTANLPSTNFSLTVGTVPNLANTITYDGVEYNVKYEFKAEGATAYTSTIPTAIGTHKMKIIVCDANAMGEQEVDYIVSPIDSDLNRVVLKTKYFMYTGSNIVIDATLYLDGVLQTGTARTYTLNGALASNVRAVGKYTITLTNGSGSSATTEFEVIPTITLSTPNTGDAFSDTAKTITYQFASTSDQALYGDKLSISIKRNGVTVSEVKDAGSYVVTLCYDGYTIYERGFTITKMSVNTLSAYVPTSIDMVYGDLSAIPTTLGGYKVRYQIYINNSFQDITPPVGSHKIKFIIDEENYQGEIATDINVSKKVLVLDVDDFEVEYTGNQISLPTTLANFGQISYKYSSTNSSFISGLPTNVGVYYIQAIASSKNYEVAYRDSSRPYIQVTITKATPTFVVTNLTQVYDGNIKVPTHSAIFNGVKRQTNISNSNIIDAGTYTVTFSINGDLGNFNISSEYTFVIEKANVDITCDIPETMVYDGTQKAIVATTSVEDVGAVNVSITKGGEITAPINTGTYIATLTTAETQNYNACTRVVTFEIIPTQTHVSCTVASFEYDGSAKPVIVSTDPTDTTVTINYTGEDNSGASYNSTNAPTNAGAYVAEITVVPADPNYSQETVYYSYTIIKVVDPITYTGPEGVEYGYIYYDGYNKTITPSSGSGTHSVVYYKLNNSGSYYSTTNTYSAGEYKAIITTTGDNNYYAATKVVYFTIYKQKIAASITGKTVTYNGEQQSIVPNILDGTNSSYLRVIYSGKTYGADGKLDQNYSSNSTPPTEAGVYTVELRPQNTNNYEIKGITHAALIIQRQELDISIEIEGVDDAASMAEFNGELFTAKAYAEINGIKTDLSTIYSGVISITRTDDPFDFQTSLKYSDEYKIVANLNHKNFIGYSKRVFTISPKRASIFLKQNIVEFTGKAVNLNYIVIDYEGIDVTENVKTSSNVAIVYKRKGENDVLETPPIATGEYTANIILSEASYAANETFAFTIIKTTPDLVYEADSGDITLSMTTNTELESFEKDSAIVTLNGTTLERTYYDIVVKKQVTTIDDATNEIKTGWEAVNVNTITAAGTYKITITIRSSYNNTFRNNLEGGLLDDSGNETLSWEYKFYISND